MARIKTMSVVDVVEAAGQAMIQAGGANATTTPGEMLKALEELSGPQRQLLSAFYQFAQTHHGKTQELGVTAKEISSAVDFAKTHLISRFDANQNGLSADEVAKMSTLGQLAVTVAENARKGRATAELAVRFTAAMANAAYTSGHTYAPRFVAGSIPPGKISREAVQEALHSPVMSFLNQGRMTDAPITPNDVVWEEYSSKDSKDFIDGLKESPTQPNRGFDDVLSLADKTLGPLKVVRIGPKGPDGQPTDGAGLYVYAVVGRAKDTGLLAGFMFGSVEA